MSSRMRTWASLLLMSGILLSPAQADSKWDAEAKRINGHFQTLDTHIKKADWKHPRTESTAQTYMKRLLNAIGLAEKRFPQQKAITDRMRVGSQRMAQAVMAKIKAAKEEKALAASKPKSTGPVYVAGSLSEEEAKSLAQPYKPYYDAAKGFPATWTADTVISSVDALQAFDIQALEKRVEADRKRFPALFQYYGMEKPGTYGDLPYGGKSKPLVKQKPLKQLIQFYIPKIYEEKAKLEGKEAAFVAGIEKAIAKADTLDKALAAQHLARVCLDLSPQYDRLKVMITESEKAVAAQTAAIQHLVSGPFHAKNFKKIVAFSSDQTLGKEVGAQAVQTLVPGKPFYLIGYLPQSVKSLGFTRHQSQLGYQVPAYPNLAFQLDTMARTLFLPTRGKVKNYKELENVGAMEIPLLPDPEKSDFASHLDYLPGLHFTRWLLNQAPGQYVLHLGLSAGYRVNPKRPGAYGSFAVDLNPESQAALKDYYQRLWKKKLATVVFPDTYGIEDRKGHIPNASALAKYGTLLRLSAAQTGQVMKPWPNQTQVKNYVGLGFGAFEKDGRCSIIPLGFSRTPEEPTLRWTSLSGTPDHITISDGKNFIGPKLYNHGYEILKENVSKTGEW